MVPCGMQIWIQVDLQALKRYLVAKHGMCKYFRSIFILAELILLYNNGALAYRYFTEQSQMLLL